MASRSERRAALRAVVGTDPTDGGAFGRSVRRVPEPLPKPAHLSSRLVDDDSEEPMKIRYTFINLHKPIERMHAGKGHWSATSTRHNATATCSIELDTATQLVRISNGTACVYVPREGVENFGPSVEDAEVHAARLAEIAREVAKANEDAIEASNAAASQPA